METIKIKTEGREQLVEITERLQAVLKDKDWQDGVLLLHCNHTTAGLTVNEAADPSVPRDILACLRRLVPHSGDYQHLEGNSDAHIKSTLVGSDQSILVANGRPILGTWQGVFLTEFDGPRTRQVKLQWLGQAST